MRRSAARSATARPVAVEPVNCTMSTRSTSASAVGPAPVATANTPSGTPLAARPSASSSEVMGVCSLGFRITALPAASAGIASPKEFVSG